jgi:branched-chain amino acid aminotransferase
MTIVAGLALPYDRRSRMSAGHPMQIEVHRTTSPAVLPPDTNLGFGRVFTDHMFMIDFDPERRWHGARIVPRAPLALDPAASVLHYGQALFEGMKGFRGVDGRVRLFRAPDHCKRMSEGAARLCMHAPDPELTERAVVELLRVDERWVPSAPNTAVYVRPTLIGTEPFLGVRPANRYTFFVILSPVGAYYESGLAPVKIWIEEHAVRAARGGLGAVKAGANYAASLLAAEEAKRRGYAQVLWLDAARHEELEEVGTMNLFVRIDDELVTPPLDGSILAGMTRDSVLTLLRSWGLRASERTITLGEVVAAHRSGKLREVFGCGTAAVISPVGELAGESCGAMKIGDGGTGEIARRLYEGITAIQYARAPDPWGWLTPVT